MRAKVRGAYHMTGIGKKSNAAYDLCKLVIETRQETVATANMKRVACGLDTKEFDLTPEAFDRFMALGTGFPVECDLVVGAKIGFRGLESVIEAVNPASLSSAPAQAKAA